MAGAVGGLLALLSIQVALQASLSSALELRIAVVTESGLLNDSLIERAVARRVGANWRVLRGHVLSAAVARVGDSAQESARAVCQQPGLSGIIGAGSCEMLEELGALAKSLRLPMIGLPSKICGPRPAATADSALTGTHPAADFVAAAAAIFASEGAKQVAILFDSKQSLWVTQQLQLSLSSSGISSFTFQVDAANGSVSDELPQHLGRLIKKRVRHLLLLATPSNTQAILGHAVTGAVLQQNYFWLVIDSGCHTASQLRLAARSAGGANLGLLRGAVALSDGCSAACSDVFQDGTAQADWIRTLDARFVDAVEALAKALNDSVAEPGFQPSNATCLPLQAWSQGPNVLARLSSLSNYNTQRGIVSFNATTRHFDSQGLEVLASFNQLRDSPLQFLRSATFEPSGGVLTKLFSYKTVSLTFPNTFMGFKNQTLIVCTADQAPVTTFVKLYPNNSVEISGLTLEVLNTLAEQMDFRFYTKQAEDGNWGAPIPNSPFFSGCVGEVQKGVVHFAASPFTKTAVRDTVIDFSVPLYEESNAILLPRPAPASKMWNVYQSFHVYVWLLLVAFIALASAAVWLFAFFSPFSAYNLRLEYAIADEIWLQEYVWSSIGSFMQQGQDYYPFCMSARTVMAFWWMFTVIIYAAYTADLTAHLTVSSSTVQIRTLSELAAQTAIRPNVVVDTNVYTLLKEAKSGVYKQIADIMITVPLDHCLEGMQNRDRACISDNNYLMPTANNNCSDYYIAAEHFNTATVAFMYPEDAVFGQLMNFHLQKLHETGAMQRLIQIYTKPDASSSTSGCTDAGGSATDADPIALNGVTGCLIVVAGLYVTGLGLLVLELLWTRLAGKQPLDCALY